MGANSWWAWSRHTVAAEAEQVSWRTNMLAAEVRCTGLVATTTTQLLKTYRSSRTGPLTSHRGALRAREEDGKLADNQDETTWLTAEHCSVQTLSPNDITGAIGQSSDSASFLSSGRKWWCTHPPLFMSAIKTQTECCWMQQAITLSIDFAANHLFFFN